MTKTLTKVQAMLGLAITLTLVDSTLNNVQANVIKASPIITKLQTANQPMSNETKKWMKRWVGTNLEDPEFEFYELSGSTSINVKVHKADPSKKDGFTPYGSFVTRGGSSNFNTEVAYYNLAAILGRDDIMRPSIRYSLGKRSTASFKALLEKDLAGTKPGSDRERRINRILNNMATMPSLLGCLKATKHDSYAEYLAIRDRTKPGTKIPAMTNPMIKALQATSPQPVGGKRITLQAGYTGDMLELARELSITMTFDVIFQQWDRYNGVNVGLSKDNRNNAHFYMTDNGGADMVENVVALNQNLGYFSRYDRDTINKLKALYNFLLKPTTGFLGYKNAETFVVDLGLYTDLPPSEYVRLLKRNLKLLLNRVSVNQAKYGNKIYLPS